MPITLSIVANDAPEMWDHLRRMTRGSLENVMANAETLVASTQPATPVSEPVAMSKTETASTGSRRRKAPAAEAVIDQPKQADVEDVTGKPEQPMLSIDDARERMKKFANDGHMDCVEKALADFNVKKVSDVDPEASGKPSSKFAAFVAKIEEFVAAKATP